MKGGYEYIAEDNQMPKIGRIGDSGRSRARKKLPLIALSRRSSENVVCPKYR
jgi:hypothetical protein